VGVPEIVQIFEGHYYLSKHLRDEVAPLLKGVRNQGHPLLKVAPTMSHDNLGEVLVNFVTEQLG
jgi:hypothetical protein